MTKENLCNIKPLEFGKEAWKNVEDALDKEWVVTNGIGGYCGGNLINCLTRTHHGYLNASIHPPVERYSFLSKVDEGIKIGKDTYSFGVNRYYENTPSGKGKKLHTEDGCKYLQRFFYDELPNFIYEVNGVFVKKTIAMENKKNTMVIAYEIENHSEEVTFFIEPFFTYREHSQSVRLDTDPHAFDFIEKKDENLITLIPKKNKDITTKFYFSEGKIKNNKEKISKMHLLEIEKKTGGYKYNVSYKPYQIEVSLKPFEKKKISIVCSIEDEDIKKDAFQIIEQERKRYDSLIKDSKVTDDFSKRLVLSADQFIVDRQSTSLKTIIAGYPWFTDWGRDTMIAMLGLCLTTKRFDDAREILLSFAKYVKNGMVPNIFPDSGLEPMYNTVDASLWYVNAVYAYLKETSKKSDYDFVKSIYGKLEEIIHFYENGTSFSIKMDKDYLISAGSGYDQVTWMDVRVGKKVITPRHGKCVEINALWYNALMIMSELSEKFGIITEYGKLSEEYKDMAIKSRESFNKKFWNKKKNCLYDVINDKDKDGKIRLNQIYSISLFFPVLDEDKRKSVVDTVVNKLYATYGLRTLDKDDPEYKPYYTGILKKRDEAYHQGTCWAYPLGGLIDAYLVAYGENEESINYCKKLLAPMKNHMYDYCIGGIAEIFDGNEPNIPRGAYNQAWSVGEVLRVYEKLNNI